MIKRIFLSFLVGVATALAVFILGGFLQIFPAVSAFGAWLISVSWVSGVLGAIVFFVFGKSIWSQVSILGLILLIAGFLIASGLLLLFLDIRIEKRSKRSRGKQRIKIDLVYSRGLILYAELSSVQSGEPGLSGRASTSFEETYNLQNQY